MQGFVPWHIKKSLVWLFVPWEIRFKFKMSNFQAKFSDWGLMYLCEIVLRWMSQDFIEDKSTLVQVIFLVPSGKKPLTGPVLI